jgi:hypothetical protein
VYFCVSFLVVVVLFFWREFEENEPKKKEPKGETVGKGGAE